MKLLRLKITDPNGFRSLQADFEHHFRTEWDLQEKLSFAPFVCAGPNGNGKSNLLEVLAAIFFHIDCLYMEKLPESFEYSIKNVEWYQSKFSQPDGFELEYLISVKDKDGFNWKENNGLAHVLITKDSKSSPIVEVLSSKVLSEELKNKDLPRHIVKRLLPEFIIGYSSGGNEILSIPFLKMRFLHFDEYRHYVQNDDFYGSSPEGRLFFLDDHLNQIILIANLLFNRQDTGAIFDEFAQVQGAQEFRLVIGLQDTVPYSEEYSQSIPFSKHSQIGEPALLSKAFSILEKLLACSTCHYSEVDEDGNQKRLTLDFHIDSESIKAFKLNFSTALEFFQAINLLYTLNYIQISDSARARIYRSKNVYIKQDLTTIALDDDSVFRIKNFKLRKRGVSKGLFTRELSDGEYQLLHTISICLLFRNTNVLFLLDEPETHFNPDWRSNFVSQVMKCFPHEGDEIDTHEMLITTHSPFLISDSKQEKVLEFNKDEAGKVSITNPIYQTFGASVDQINMLTFKKAETVGSLARSEMDSFAVNHEKPDEAIKELNTRFGDSVEKMLLIHSILHKSKKRK